MRGSGPIALNWQSGDLAQDPDFCAHLRQVSDLLVKKARAATGERVGVEHHVLMAVGLDIARAAKELERLESELRHPANGER